MIKNFNFKKIFFHKINFEKFLLKKSSKKLKNLQYRYSLSRVSGGTHSSPVS